MIPTSKHLRRSLALRGIAAILFGVLALAWPGITLLALLVLFGIYAIVDGIIALVGSFYVRRAMSDWWLILLVGLFSIAIGILTFARPGVTALVLMLFIAARALFLGFTEIVRGVQYRKEIQGEWLLVLGGAFSILFGVIVFAYPFSGALAIVWLIGLYAILYGASILAFSIFTRHGELPVEEMGGRPAISH